MGWKRESSYKLFTRHFLSSDGKKKGFIEAVSGGLAVGVPSLVSTVEKVHNKYGKIALELSF